MTDISGLDKIAVLRALWENQQPALFFGNGSGPSFDESQAKRAIIGGNIDYFCGRAIKADLSGDKADFNLYDHDAPFSGAHVIAKLRDQSLKPSALETQAAAKQRERRAEAVASDPKMHILEKQRVCKDGTTPFAPYGKELIPGKPGTVMCIHCGGLKRSHPEVWVSADGEQ